MNKKIKQLSEEAVSDFVYHYDERSSGGCNYWHEFYPDVKSTHLERSGGFEYYKASLPVGVIVCDCYVSGSGRTQRFIVSVADVKELYGVIEFHSREKFQEWKKAKGLSSRSLCSLKCKS